MSQSLQWVQQLASNPDAIDAVYREADLVTDRLSEGLTMNLSELAEEIYRGQKDFHIPQPDAHGLEALVKMPAEQAVTELKQKMVDYSRAILNVGYAVGTIASRSGSVTADGLNDAISICIDFVYNKGTSSQRMLFDGMLSQLSRNYSDKDINITSGLITTPVLNTKIEENMMEEKMASAPDYRFVLKAAFEDFPQVGRTAFAVGYALAISDSKAQLLPQVPILSS